MSPKGRKIGLGYKGGQGLGLIIIVAQDCAVNVSRLQIALDKP